LHREGPSQNSQESFPEGNVTRDRVKSQQKTHSYRKAKTSGHELAEEAGKKKDESHHRVQETLGIQLMFSETYPMDGTHSPTAVKQAQLSCSGPVHH